MVRVDKAILKDLSRFLAHTDSFLDRDSTILSAEVVKVVAFIGIVQDQLFVDEHISPLMLFHMVIQGLEDSNTRSFWLHLLATLKVDQYEEQVDYVVDRVFRIMDGDSCKTRQAWQVLTWICKTIDPVDFLEKHIDEVLNLVETACCQLDFEIAESCKFFVVELYKKMHCSSIGTILGSRLFPLLLSNLKTSRVRVSLSWIHGMASLITFELNGHELFDLFHQVYISNPHFIRHLVLETVSKLIETGHSFIPPDDAKCLFSQSVRVWRLRTLPGQLGAVLYQMSGLLDCHQVFELIVRNMDLVIKTPLGIQCYERLLRWIGPTTNSKYKCIFLQLSIELFNHLVSKNQEKTAEFCQRLLDTFQDTQEPMELEMVLEILNIILTSQGSFDVLENHYCRYLSSDRWEIVDCAINILNRLETSRFCAVFDRMERVVILLKNKTLCDEEYTRRGAFKWLRKWIAAYRFHSSMDLFAVANLSRMGRRDSDPLVRQYSVECCREMLLPGQLDLEEFQHLFCDDDERVRLAAYNLFIDFLRIETRNVHQVAVAYTDRIYAEHPWIVKDQIHKLSSLAKDEFTTPEGFYLAQHILMQIVQLSHSDARETEVSDILVHLALGNRIGNCEIMDCY